MGRHKDPETLQFIEELKKKGESLGFRVQDEFKVMEGLFWIDLTLTPYEKSHDTFITIEIESKENERIYKNFDKIIETPAELLEKPFKHFILIYNGGLTRGNQFLIEQKISSYNVKIFQDLKNNSGEVKRLFRDLEGYKLEIESLIERKAKVNLGETVKEAILGLGKVSPLMIVSNKPLKINQVTISSGSQGLKGTPVMSSSQVFDSKKYKQFAIVPIPRETYTLVIPGTPIALDTYKEEEESAQTIILTFELCDFPIIIKVEKDNKLDSGRFETKIDPNEADAIQLKKFEDILRGLYAKRKFEVYHNLEKVCWFHGVSSQGYSVNDDYYSNLSDIALIQEMTCVKIAAPKNLSLTPKDQSEIKFLKSIIQTGVYTGAFEEVSIDSSKQTILKLVDSAKRQGSLKDIKIEFSTSSQQIQSVYIPLGDVTYEFVDAKFKEPIANILNMLDKKFPEEEVNIILVPASSDQCRAVYSKWKKE